MWNGESDSDKYVGDVVSFLEEKGLIEYSDGALVMQVKKDDDKVEMPPLLVRMSSDAISYGTTDLATIWERVKLYKLLKKFSLF